MVDKTEDNKGKTKAEISFAEISESKQQSLISEYIEFIRENKKYWLIPLLIVLFALSILVLFGGTSAAPFIYTLF